MFLSEKLKSMLCLLLVIFAVSGAAVADEADSIRTSLTRENALHPGMYSFIFQIDEQFTLRPFNGMGIALKRHSSRKSAFRIGFGLGMDRDEDESSRWAEREDSLLSRRYDTRNTNSYNVKLELLYMMYPWPDSYVNFYWGTGPLASFSWGDTERKSGIVYSDDGARESLSKSDYRIWSAGAKGVAGVEWFANRRISFQLEYQAELYYQSRSSESESSSTDNSLVNYDEDTSTSVMFRASTVISV